MQSYSWIVKGAGGIVGGILAANLTEHYHPKWCFLVYSMLGIFVALSGFKLNKEIDSEGLEEKRGFFQDMMQSAVDIWKIRKHPLLLKVLVYVLLKGILVPSFGSFWYYYETKIKHFSQFYIGMMSTLSYAALLVGSLLYQQIFSKQEFRTALTLENFLTFFCGLLGVVFVVDLH